MAVDARCGHLAWRHRPRIKKRKGGKAMNDLFSGIGWEPVLRTTVIAVLVIMFLMMPIYIAKTFTEARRCRKLLEKIDERFKSVERAAQVQVEAQNAAYNAQFRRTP